MRYLAEIIPILEDKGTSTSIALDNSHSAAKNWLCRALGLLEAQTKNYLLHQQILHGRIT